MSINILCDANYRALSNKFITLFKLCKVKISIFSEFLKAEFNLGYFLFSKMLTFIVCAVQIGYE